MLKIVPSNQFKRDLKLARKQAAYFMGPVYTKVRSKCSLLADVGREFLYL